MKCYFCKTREATLTYSNRPACDACYSARWLIFTSIADAHQNIAKADHETCVEALKLELARRPQHIRRTMVKFLETRLRQLDRARRAAQSVKVRARP